MMKKRTRPKTYEAEMGGRKVRVTVPESDGYIDLSAAQAAQHEAWQPLTIREANRLAKGRAKVSADSEDARLWRVERPGSVQAHEPMAREAWLAFLETGVAAPTKDGQTAAEVYAERRRDIDRLMDGLGQELAKHQKQAKADPRNWGAAGDLCRIRSCLIEALAGLRGVEVENIEDHLDTDVPKVAGCPQCGERCLDKLVWQDDGETVRCATCGKRYTPPTK